MILLQGNRHSAAATTDVLIPGTTEPIPWYSRTEPPNPIPGFPGQRPEPDPDPGPESPSPPVPDSTPGPDVFPTPSPGQVPAI